MYNWKLNYKNNTDADMAPPMQTPPMMINMVGDTMGGSPFRVFENKIFFYGVIDDNTMLELNRLLVELDVKLQNTKNVLGDGYDPIIHLHLSTPGGSLLDAFGCVDTIRMLKSKVYTYVDGMVASAGTLISCVGHKRFIGQNGHLLIHQLSGMMGGTYAEMEDQFFNSTHLMKVLKDFYKKYTKIPMKRLDEILKKDLFLTAEECLQYGIVDQVL